MYLTTEPQIHEAKTDRIEEKNKEFNNNSWRLQYFAFNDEYNNQGDSQQKNRRLEQHYKPTRTFPQQKQKTHSQVHREHFPGQIICQIVKEALINLKELKSYKIHSLTSLESNQQ